MLPARATVPTQADVFLTTWSVSNLGEVDREIVRLSELCDIRIFDAEVIERLLRDDASVCAKSNRYAFKKLRGMLMLYYHARMRAAHRLGKARATLLAQALIERLGSGKGRLAGENA